jgi:hypothetical protein
MMQASPSRHPAQQPIAKKPSSSEIATKQVEIDQTIEDNRENRITQIDTYLKKAILDLKKDDWMYRKSLE